MRGSKLLGLSIVCATVVACGSSPGSPPPTAPAASTSPTPSATPLSTSVSSSPTPLGSSATAGSGYGTKPWTYATGDVRGLSFASDGTAYLFAWNGDTPSRLVALDRSGAVKSGWPVDMPDPGIGGGPVTTPDGDVLVLGLAYDDQGVISYALERLGPDGTAREGWPFRFDKGSECSGPVIDADAAAIVACGSDAGSRIVAVRPDGKLAWDTQLATIRGATNLARTDDGMLYVTSAMGDGIMAVTSAGLIPDGWPVEAGKDAGTAPTPNGLLAWWHQAAAEDICHADGTTIYEVLGPDGAPRTNWPQAVVGYASEPAVGPDGSVYVVDGTKHAIAYGPDGRVRNGWPAKVAGVTGSCFGPPTPSVAADGTAFVATGGQPSDGALTAIGPDGHVLDGWPVSPDIEFAYPCRGCAPGPPEPNTALASGPVTYIAMYRGDTGDGTDVLALDRSGAELPGWPVHLAAGEVRLQLAPDGRLFAILVDPDDSSHTTLAYLVGPG